MAALSKTQMERLTKLVERDSRLFIVEFVKTSSRQELTELQRKAMDMFLGMKFVISNLTAVNCITREQRDSLYGLIDKYHNAICDIECFKETKTKDGEKHV